MNLWGQNCSPGAVSLAWDAEMPPCDDDSAEPPCRRPADRPGRIAAPSRKMSDTRSPLSSAGGVDSAMFTT